MIAKTVLIIDDSDELRSLLENVLPLGGYQTISAATGRDGLHLAAEAKPDVILVDLDLPDMNGLKVLETLHRDKQLIPTVIITGYGSEGVAARALDLGAFGYLIKPCTTEEVLSSIEKALNRGQLLGEKEQLNSLIHDYRLHVSTLATLGQTLVLGVERGECLQRIAEAAVFVTRADRCLLSLAQEDGDHLGIEAIPGQATTGRRFSPQAGDPPLRAVLERGVTARITAPPSSAILMQTGDSVQAVLQVPVKTRVGVIGFLSADRQKAGVPFSLHDEQMLSILATYAVLALDKESQDRSVTPLSPSV